MECTETDGRPVPALVPTLDHGSYRIVLRPPLASQLSWNKADLTRRTRSVIAAAIEAALPDIHPDRILFATAGQCFVPSAPRPIGGKTRPAYKSFEGSTAEDLIEWLLDKALEPPLGGRGRKKLDPGLALAFVVGVVNHVLDAERGGRKDEVDESALRGMEWAGHPLSGRIVLPRHLRSGYKYKKRRGSGEPTRTAEGDMSDEEHLTAGNSASTLSSFVNVNCPPNLSGGVADPYGAYDLHQPFAHPQHRTGH